MILGLLSINAVLAAGLVSRYWHEPKAYGQARSRAALLTISGHVNNRMVFFIMDANSGRLAVARADTSSKAIVTVANADVMADMARAFRK
jgi:hypothetical protein